MQIPKTIVQTGTVDPTHKMYIEDYVHIFLKQQQEDQADFALYGRMAEEDGLTYYFLYGAVREEAGWEHRENRYFGTADRIGEATCDGKEIWLFFKDGYAAPLDGYFIFYEQNEDMQAYLIEVHRNLPGEEPPAPTYQQKTFTEKTEPEDKLGEPRRISGRPRNYPEISTARQFSYGRAIPAVLLLTLIVIGIGSINRDQEVREVGSFLTEVWSEAETQERISELAPEFRSDEVTGETMAENMTETGFDFSGIHPAETNEALPETSLSADTMQTADVSPAQPITYTVRVGDNLAAILRAHYGSTDRIQEVIDCNNLSNPNHLYPGQKIILPE